MIIPRGRPPRSQAMSRALTVRIPIIPNRRRARCINPKFMETIADQSFRDHLATVDAKGRRKWVFAQKPSGKWYRLRTYISLCFFILFFTLPFVYVHGQPLFLFNIPGARFIIFGRVFWPQDFFIFGLTMVTFIVFVVLFTAAFGRLFCGWVCPQTIFMEMLFRKVEYWIEGDAAKQKLLSKAPWTGSKIGKKVA